VPRPKTSETGERIRVAAMELIAEKGVQQVSLREIAERVGITKPALYYHFASREELLRGLVQPLIDDVAELLAVEEHDPRRLLANYFDVTYRHRAITRMVITDPSVLAHLNLAAEVNGWRRRLTTLVFGPTPTLTQEVRAAVAIGGLGDCTILDLAASAADVRRVTLEAAYDTLGL
jgi:AcrR family transcriptional regulator